MTDYVKAIKYINSLRVGEENLNINSGPNLPNQRSLFDEESSSNGNGQENSLTERSDEPSR